ncbi:hypothetical protein [Streptomyces sp. NBC_00162]|uniref:hypothetical protein n=1 Tax=Streptomyces sp. NBC_00162 TaxID=2903629 RepID=UPI00214B4DC0|nr:hypothetical protein [Streptomyces sp. NBC_00162]UUU42124.1 hypothetical protein JIW86_26905 [Streptomyces sp. NBC_00162]
MTPSSRRLLAAVLCACALAAGGCAAHGGLGKGTPAPPVSSQPRPEPLWPAWTQAPGGSAVGRREPAPKPLKNAPEPGPKGLAGLNPTDVARSDPRMKPYLGKETGIRAPGRAGIRPAVYRDLTGDGQPDLIVAADVPTGRSALSVYAVVNGKIVSILLTIGRQLTAETIGTDLLVHIAADDGSEQAVRYHWDGERMTVVNDERRFRKDGGNTR